MGQEEASTFRQGETGFHALIELSPDFVALLDKDGTVRYASPAVTRVLGYEPGEVVGRPFPDFLHPEERPAGADDPARVLEADEDAPAELRFVHKDGSVRILETLAKNYADTRGIEGLVVSTRDITGRVQSEQELRSSLEQADDLYNHAPCGYHSLDENGIIVRINDTELEWLGWTREEVLGKARFTDFLTPESRTLFEHEFPVFKATGRIEEKRFELVSRDGAIRPVLVTATAITDESGRVVMSRSTLYDITERDRAESSLRRVNRALRVLSAVNSELIRAEEESELLRSICDVCVRVGGYRMAWVGFALPDKAKTVRPMAQAGFDAGYLKRAKITWGKGARGRGPTGTAIRTGERQVNQNFLTNPKMAPWRDQALQRGYEASLALPLKDASGTFGALMIYAVEPDAFDAEELRLLTELADDLAYGITALRDRQQRKVAEARLAHLAYFDELTGLPNRNQLLEVLAEGARGDEGGEATALLTLNAARFSEIQAGIGVRQSDELLRQLGDRLRDALGEGEFLARIGGDLFAVVLRPGDEERARACGRRIEQALSRPFEQVGIPITVQVRIGVAIAPEHGLEPEALMLRSEIAARHAKASGADFEIYGGPTESESPRHLELITELRAAIESEQFILEFQPRVDLLRGTVTGLEALVRWRHPERGELQPAEFIGLAEQTGLIEPLTFLVLESAIRQSHEWQKQGFSLPVAVNISVSSFYDPDFRGEVGKLLRKWGVSPGRLELEITESTLMEEPRRVRELLNSLRDEGIHISIDDFGTGYSSLSYVSNLPIHALKIDRSFILGMLESPRTRSVVEAIVSLARALGIGCVAEGVDSRDQLEALIQMGCSEIQGYFFSPPVGAEAVRPWADGFSLEAFGLRPPFESVPRVE